MSLIMIELVWNMSNELSALLQPTKHRILRFELEVVFCRIIQISRQNGKLLVK